MLSQKLQDPIGVGTSWGAAEGRGGSSRPSTGIKSLHRHHFQDGVWDFFFYCSFFPSPPLSLSLSFWPIFVFCRGSGVFLKQLFRRRLLSDGRSVGKSSLPPAIAPPTRPALLLLLLRAAAAFWSMQRNTAPEPEESSKNSLLQPPGAQLLPEGAMAKWVSPDLLQSPYAQWGPCFP